MGSQHLLFSRALLLRVLSAGFCEWGRTEQALFPAPCPGSPPKQPHSCSLHAPDTPVPCLFVLGSPSRVGLGCSGCICDKQVQVRPRAGWAGGGLSSRLGAEGHPRGSALPGCLSVLCLSGPQWPRWEQNERSSLGVTVFGHLLDL